MALELSDTEIISSYCETALVTQSKTYRKAAMTNCLLTFLKRLLNALYGKKMAVPRSYILVVLNLILISCVQWHASGLSLLKSNQTKSKNLICNIL